MQLLGRSKSARPVVAEKVDGVLIDRIATENVVELGPQLVALADWNELGLGDALDQAGLNASQIATHSLAITSLPLDDGRVIHIRKPSLPDPEQALIYKHLRIDWKSAFPQIKTFAKA